MDEQRRLILNQFTQQAVPFSQLHGNDEAEVYRLLISTAGITSSDDVLDVACGPGLVACEVAKVARSVTGVDLTPAMIQQATHRQEALGLTNLNWVVGDAYPLPFADHSFSHVVTRYSFHHFSKPAAAFAEMLRVCRPGGRVTVCDVFTTSVEQSRLYDQMEIYRDPSHTHALLLTELEELFGTLPDVRRTFYQYPVKVDLLLSRSFPEAGGADAFRKMVAADIGVNRIGIDANDVDGLAFAFPVVVLSGQKPKESQ